MKSLFMSSKKRKKGGIIVSAVLSALLVTSAAWFFFNRQYVVDQLVVWSYRPSTEIASIAQKTDLTNKGTFHFYATQPEVASADTFNQDCPRQEVGNPILGCYTSDHRIYIYDITNDQLEGMEEVTAAHEMLHAVWERLGEGEKDRVSKLIDAEYTRLVADAEFKERMDYYSRTEPGQFYNELHSIIGTEIKGISPELESYYAEYFSDRDKVLSFHDAYNSVFLGLRSQSESLYAEITTLGTDLEARSAKYNSDVARLSADIQSFNNRADSGSFSSMAQFNRERSALLARSNQLESDRTAINRDIATYNQKYEQYQALTVQIESLNKSIDSLSDLQPAPGL